MFYNIIIVFIFLLHSSTLCANLLDLSIYKQNVISVADFNTNLTFNAKDTSKNGYITKISYTNSDWSYGLLFYISNSQKTILQYSNFWTNTLDSSLKNDQSVKIEHIMKDLLGLSIEYSFYKIENISFKIGMNVGLVRNSYSIKYIYNYDSRDIHKTIVTNKHQVGDYISENILDNTNMFCTTSEKSNDLEYTYNEQANSYKIESGFLLCHYNKTTSYIINNQSEDKISKISYNFNYSPYFVMEMGIWKNLYLNAKIGINVYNSINISYNNSNISFELNSPKYSDYYSIGFIYYFSS